MAEASANNWEMLTNEPTTSSGEGIAEASLMPARLNASAPSNDQKVKAAAPTTRRAQFTERIYSLPRFGMADNPGRGDHEHSRGLRNNRRSLARSALGFARNSAVPDENSRSLNG